MTEPGLLYLTALGQVSERARELDDPDGSGPATNGELLEVLVDAIAADRHDEHAVARASLLDCAALLVNRIVDQDRRHP